MRTKGITKKMAIVFWVSAIIYFLGVVRYFRVVSSLRFNEGSSWGYVVPIILLLVIGGIFWRWRSDQDISKED